MRTCVVCCTDGKLATIVDPDMPEETTRPRLAEIREAELRDACRILRVDEVEFLRYGNSGMPDAPTNQLPDAFWMAPLHEATGRIVAEIRRFRPHVVVTYDGNGGYGHPDHIQTHRATLLAVEAAQLSPDVQGHRRALARRRSSTTPRSRRSEYASASSRWRRQAGMDPPFGEDNPDNLAFLTPDEWVTTTMDCRSVVARKREALRAHRSQISADWPQLTISDEVAEQFATEFYQLVISRTPAVLPETDLFAGISAS